MKIAHECPLLIADLLKDYTDYSYYISTICLQVPEYFEYAKKDTSYKILDCGTFEEGKPMPTEEYLKYIEAIKPDEFIIPDHLFQKDLTLESAKEWLEIIESRDIQGLPIAVVQGRTLEEQVECYLELTKLYTKVAIPYDLPSSKRSSDALQEMFPLLDLPPNGRYDLIEHLFLTKQFNKKKKHHFLGIDTPTELLQYNLGKLKAHKVLSRIDSIDTSSPILHGLKGIEYNPEYGLLKKNKTMMKELILEKSIDSIQEYLILKNISIFKSFCS